MKRIVIGVEIADIEKARLLHDFPFIEFSFDAFDLEADALFIPLELIKQQNSNHLQWIHLPLTPLTSPQKEFLHRIHKKEISISMAPADVAQNITEFIFLSVLYLIKGWNYYLNNSLPPSEIKPSLQGKTWLQIGITDASLETCRYAEQLGCNVWSLSHSGSFRPYCRKNFSLSHLHALLPYSDVVCIDEAFSLEIDEPFIEHIKEGSILLILGKKEKLSLKKIKYMLQEKQLLGIIYDGPEINTSLPQELAHKFISFPEISACPIRSEMTDFECFYHNLKKFNINDTPGMKGLLFGYNRS